MELTLNRKIKSGITTIGDFLINGSQTCYSLEDTDRGLKQTDSLDRIKAIKVQNETAIPAGHYEVALTFSNHFQKYLPLLIDVPGYAGVRIHPGNYAKDTDGCILLGETKSTDFIGSSQDAFKEFMSLFEPASKTEKIFITIS